MSNLVLSLLFVSFLVIKETCCFSFSEHVHDTDVRTTLPDFRTSDADVGARSAFVGSFRGAPIKSRQRNVFIDAHGIPIPMLPYNDNSEEYRVKQLSLEQKLRKMRLFVKKQNN